jgi:hypothetical protein
MKEVYCILWLMECQATVTMRRTDVCAMLHAPKCSVHASVWQGYQKMRSGYDAWIRMTLARAVAIRNNKKVVPMTMSGKRDRFRLVEYRGDSIFEVFLQAA